MQIKPLKRQRYYWLLCVDPQDNKPFLVPGGETEELARQKGFESLGGIDFEVRELPTRNMARASAIVRGKRLDETHDIHRARQRLGHDRSLLRMKLRRQRGY